LNVLKLVSQNKGGSSSDPLCIYSIDRVLKITTTIQKIKFHEKTIG